MGTDVERMVQSLPFMHEIWASLVDVIVAIILLERQLGLACLAPIVLVVGMLRVPVVVIWPCKANTQDSLHGPLYEDIHRRQYAAAEVDPEGSRTAPGNDKCAGQHQSCQDARPNRCCVYHGQTPAKG